MSIDIWHRNLGREVIAVATMEGGSRRVIWIIVAVVVVAIAAGAYFLLYGGNSGTGTSGGGAGYFVIALSIRRTRWISRKLRSILS
jgi:hypothetical protein